MVTALTGPPPAPRTAAAVVARAHTGKGHHKAERTPLCRTLPPRQPMHLRTPPTLPLVSRNTQRTPRRAVTHLRTPPTPRHRASQVTLLTVTPRRFTLRALRATLSSYTRLTRHRRHIHQRRRLRTHRHTPVTRNLITGLLATAGPPRTVSPMHPPMHPRRPAILRPAIIPLTMKSQVTGLPVIPLQPVTLQ